nr:hypothetical protein [Tanacetum cinerariifolium]
MTLSGWEHFYTSWAPKKSGKHHSSKKELAHRVATLWKLVERFDQLYCRVDDPLSICYCVVESGDRVAQLYEAIPLMKIKQKRIVETIYVDFDELTAMASEQSSSGPVLNEMTPTTISSGLVPKPSSLTPYVPPTRNNWDLLFQSLFDELLTPPPSVDPSAPEVIALIADVIPPVQVESTASPSSTTVDQDASSPSKSQTTPETQSSVIPQDVEEDIHDIEVA